MNSEALFERLWSGAARMEEWTAAVSQGTITQVAENIITIHSTYFCGSVTIISTDEGLVFIDTGNPEFASRTLAVARTWNDGPIHTVIFTHGHTDHSSGITAIDAEADAKGVPRPRIVAHRNVQRRFDRYEASRGLLSIVQGQQFSRPDFIWPVGQRRPDEIYDDTLSLSVGSEQLELFHGRGETDDATFIWLPRHRVLATGDFVIWAFPNAGNPRKVQRYAAEWAVALRRMDSLNPEVLIPGHGPIVFGAERAAQMLRDGAGVLEYLVRETLALLNSKGASLDEVLHAVRAPSAYLAEPYLRAEYDDPEFVVHSIYHFYTGWFDGDPAHLKPARRADLAQELAQMAGGEERLVRRAAELAEEGQMRLALHLAEFAGAAAPDNKDIQAARAAILQKCIDHEESLMGKAFLKVY